MLKHSRHLPMTNIDYGLNVYLFFDQRLGLHIPVRMHLINDNYVINRWYDMCRKLQVK